MVACIGICGMAQVAVFFKSSDAALGWRVAGLAVFALAHVLFWSAVVSHGGDRPQIAFGTDVPRRLLRAGPYRWVRHPFYLAYTVAWLGGALVSASPWLVATAIVMFLVYRSAAITEEAAILSSHFAAEYQEYQRRTGMFIPKLYIGRPSDGRVHHLLREATAPLTSWGADGSKGIVIKGMFKRLNET
jgi:protein-S-isoprenylcysteine O-methyltransferase Ste14